MAPPTCLALRSRDSILDLSLCIRSETRPPSLKHRCSAPTAFRRAAGHRASMLMCLLFAAPSVLFGSHAAVELLSVEPLRPLAR